MRTHLIGGVQFARWVEYNLPDGWGTISAKGAVTDAQNQLCVLWMRRVWKDIIFYLL